MKKLYEEQKAAKSIIRAWKTAVARVNAFAEDLEKESIKLTSEILVGFMNEGPPYLARIVIQNASAQFQKAGIRAGTVLQRGIEIDAGQVAQEFAKHRNVISSACREAGIGPNLISVKNGQAIFSKSDEIEIRERFTFYLRPSEEELYGLLSEFSQRYNSLKMKMEEAGRIPLDDNLMALFTQGSASPIQHGFATQELRADTYLVFNEKGELIPNPAWFGREKKLENLYKTII
jgi:hypothetical protein